MIGEQAGSRWMALTFIGVGLLLGLAAGAVIFFGLPGAGTASLATGSDSAGAVPVVTTPAPAPVVGAPAPDFALTGLDGEAYRLSNLTGQVVLINFWATWCGPCEAEMPAIEKRYQAFKDRGLTVLAVNLAEPADDVRAFVERLGLTFPILMDPDESVFDLYRVLGYPTTFVVDQEGTIIQQHIGYMTDDQLDQFLVDAGVASQ